MLYLNGQFKAAQSAFERALRWAPGNQALYRAHAALAASKQGLTANLRSHYEELVKLEPLPLYAEYLGAELLLEMDKRELALKLLQRFIAQAQASPVEISIGLRAEILRAQLWLAESDGVSVG